MARDTKAQALPPAKSQDPQALPLLRALRDTVMLREGQSGPHGESFVRFKDLVDIGLATSSWQGSGQSTNIVPGAKVPSYLPSNPAPTVETPPVPTGLTATSAIQSVILQWDSPYDKYASHSFTEVWRNSTTNLATAVKVGTSTTAFYTDNVGLAATQKFYWVRFVNEAAKKGPFSKTWVSATTGKVGNADLTDSIITANKIANSAVTQSKVAKWFAGTSGTSFPASPDDGEFFYRTDQDKVYRYNGSSWIEVDYLSDPTRIGSAVIGSAAIIDAAITSAKIKNAAVGSAAIANLAVTNAKLADVAVDTAKIADGAIATAKIGSAAVTEAKIQNLSVTTAKIAGAAITNAKIQNLAVTNAKVNDLSADKITAGTVTASQVYIGSNNVQLDGSNSQVAIVDSQATPVKRVTIGKLGTGSADYGIFIKDAGGNNLLSTARDFDHSLVDLTQATNAVAEGGADVTGSHTASDVQTGAGKAVAESGADVTGNNTANDVQTGAGKAVSETGADNTSARITSGLDQGGVIQNSTNILLDLNNKALSLNNSTFGNAGIQLQYNGGSPRMYVGDGGNQSMNYDGATFSLGRDVEMKGAVAYNNQSFVLVGLPSDYQLYTNSSGGGSVSPLYGHILITCGGSAGDYAYYGKNLSLTPQTPTWANPRALKITFLVDSATSGFPGGGSGIWIGTGDYQAGPPRTGFGVYIGQGTVQGYAANGGSISYATLDGSALTDTKYNVEAIFSPGSGVLFYLNGSQLGGVSTNLPTGTSYADAIIGGYASNGSGNGGGHAQIGWMAVQQNP